MKFLCDNCHIIMIEKTSLQRETLSIVRVPAVSMEITDSGTPFSNKAFFHITWFIVIACSIVPAQQ